jgi:hypothetical protein
MFIGYKYMIQKMLWAGESGNRIPVDARFSVPDHTSLGAHPACCTMDTASFWGKSVQGVALTLHLQLALRLKKEVWAFTVCSRVVTFVHTLVFLNQI